MDVYSCRDFDGTAVEMLLAERLGAYDLQVTDVSASLEYKFASRPARIEATAVGSA
jgi:hypothetical protein